MLATSLGFRTGSFATSTYFDELSANKLRLNLRFAIFEQQRQDFTKIGVQLVKRFGLRVRSWKSGDEADEEPRFRRPFDDSGVDLHMINTPFVPVLFSAPPRLRVKPFSVNSRRVPTSRPPKPARTRR